MSKHFRVTFITDETKLPTLIGLLSGEVDGFHVDDLDKVSLPAKAKSNGKGKVWDKTTFRPVNEWPSAQLIFKLLDEQGAMTSNDISEKFSGSGFAIRTAASVLHNLVKAGFVTRLPSQERGQPSLYTKKV